MIKYFFFIQMTQEKYDQLEGKNKYYLSLKVIKQVTSYRKSRLRFLWWLLFLCLLNSGRPCTGVTEVVTATFVVAFSCITLIYICLSQF